MSARIAVAATAPFGADVLQRLAASYEISVLLTRPDAPAGRGRRLAQPPAKDAADQLGIPVLQPEALEAGLELDAPTVVAVAYGRLVPESLLAERLWLNVHPSLLPRWRGAAPVERALMAGDDETGVTIIELVKELDAGPIAAQRAFVIEADDDAGAVYANAAPIAVELLADVLDAPDRAHPPQPDEGVMYADKITAADRVLDLSRPPRELVNRVRALSPHIGARARLHGRDVTVWRAHVAEDGSFEALEVQPRGGRRMEYAAWLRGLR
ncbi:MAG: methionyl-tRNA formyltransferase [Actinobacteria bacterium]|nr:methionyl-tRNA formyltransferase [Actinomycetota bacterium]